MMSSFRKYVIAVVLISVLFASRGANHLYAARLELLSRSLLQAPAVDAEFSGDALLLCSGSGLYLFPDWRNPDERIAVPMPDEVKQVRLAGEKAFVSIKGKGFMEVDISDLLKPVAGRLIRYGGIGLLDAYGEHIVVSGDGGEVRLYTRLKDGQIKLSSSINLDSPVVSLAISGNSVTVVRKNALGVMRITESHGLSIVSEHNLPFRVKKGISVGRLTLLLKEDGELAYLLLDPSEGEIDGPYSAGGRRDIVDISVNGERGVLLGRNGKVTTLHLKHSGGEEGGVSIEYGKSFSPSLPVSPKNKWDFFGRNRVKWNGISFDGSRLAVLSSVSGISTYERTGDSFIAVSSLEIRGFAIDMVARDGYIYLANGRDGLRIGRVDENGTTRWIGHLPSFEARDVALDGKTLILADGRKGLKTVDVSDPEKPRLIGTKSSPFFQSAVVCRDGLAFTAGGLGGVEIYDVRNPAKIKLLWRKKFSEVRGVHVDDSFLYFPDGEAGFRIFSRKQIPPVELASFDTPGWSDDCFVMEDTAYIADGFKGLLILDISDRRNPVELGKLNLGYLTRELHALDKTVFVAAHVGGVFAVDASDPCRPAVTAHFDTADDARGVFADENFVYLASGSGGVYIFRYER